MKKIYILLISSLLYYPVAAQITTDELPVSFNIPADELKTKSSDLRIMPKLDMAKISEEDQKDMEKGLPPRFGFPHEANFSLSNSGIWSSLPNGDRIWQLSIQCSDALSINLLYDKFWLPDGAKLFLYTRSKDHTLGAITSLNNKGTAEDVQGFATGLLCGESITLEYYVPKEVKEDGIISIARVVHGYRYINLPDDSTQSLGSSDNCQVNVNCSEGTNWQQEKNAVAMILVGGIRECTGSLINTTCKPSGSQEVHLEVELPLV